MLSKMKGGFKHLFIHIRTVFHEKTFSKENATVKYVLQKSKTNSKYLIVSFPAFQGKSVAGRYNYLRTLKPFSANKLFILDDKGFFHVGTYCLGEDFEWFNAALIESLCAYVKTLCQAEHLIFIGSSKGGSTALLYGLRMNVDAIIAGSPQYHIAQYLRQNEYHEEILRCITKSSKEKEQQLDTMIAQEITNQKGNHTKIYLMMSSQEPSYEKDVQPMMDAIKQRGIPYEAEDKEYQNHGDTGNFFIPYLKQTIQKLMENEP